MRHQVIWLTDVAAEGSVDSGPDGKGGLSCAFLVNQERYRDTKTELHTTVKALEQERQAGARLQEELEVGVVHPHSYEADFVYSTRSL
jgi:hypothetical protein